MRDEGVNGQDKRDGGGATGDAAAPHALGDQDTQDAGLVNGGRTSPMLRQASEQPRSGRRDVLKRAGVAAIASVGGLSLLDVRRAEAATGGNFLLGNANDAGATTSLAPSSSTAPNPLFTLNGSNLTSTATTLLSTGPVGGKAIAANASSGGSSTIGIAISASGSGSAIGVSSSSGSGNGVQGSSGTGIGVYGSSSSGNGVRGKSTTGYGVSAVGGKAQLYVAPAGSAGPPTSGTHNKGEVYVDSTGVHWHCTLSGTPGTWARAITTGTNANGARGTTLQTSGAATAVQGQALGTGYAVLGQISNTASSVAAVRGQTNGHGPGVQGISPVRGGSFSGNAAQINLVPSSLSTHPTSGAKGDLFVDSSGRLWYCRLGGSIATWKQLA